jgi:hypothetical protein
MKNVEQKTTEIWCRDSMTFAWLDVGVANEYWLQFGLLFA